MKTKLFAILYLSFLTMISCKKTDTEVPLLALNYSTSPISLNGIDAKFSANISYNSHPRSAFDIFIPQSQSTAPTSLVIYVHGGGFVSGRKEDVYKDHPDDIRYYLQNNIAFATINYQLAPDDTTKGIYASLDDIRRCLQFIRYYATSLNINKVKIASYGGSAGGGASIWLAFHPEMADAANSDPILHESTRLAAVGHTQSQCSYDPVQMGALFTPMGIDYFTLPDVTESLFEDFGLTSLDQLYTDAEAVAVRKDLDMLGWMIIDDPELFTSNKNPNTNPTDKGEANHHPLHAKALLDKATAIGLPCVAYIPSLGIASSSEETIAEFMKRKLQ